VHAVRFLGYTGRTQAPPATGLVEPNLTHNLSG
jgi:hypothetical protein